jgi:hypothetical protein
MTESFTNHYPCMHRIMKVSVKLGPLWISWTRFKMNPPSTAHRLINDTVPTMLLGSWGKHISLFTKVEFSRTNGGFGMSQGCSLGPNNVSRPSDVNKTVPQLRLLHTGYL